MGSAEISSLERTCELVGNCSLDLWSMYVQFSEMTDLVRFVVVAEMPLKDMYCHCWCCCMLTLNVSCHWATRNMKVIITTPVTLHVNGYIIKDASKKNGQEYMATFKWWKLRAQYKTSLPVLCQLTKMRQWNLECRW